MNYNQFELIMKNNKIIKFRVLLLFLPLLLTSKVKAQILLKPIPDKLIVLTFDDAIVSQATYVAPLLKKYGFGATFFVCEFTAPPFSDKTKYMSWEQIAMLNKMGFEVGNHTQNHAHVSKLDSLQLTAELKYIEDKCAEYRIPKPTSFAYPAYDTSPKAISVLKARGYNFARQGLDMPYDPLVSHPYLIPGYTIKATNREQIYDAFEAAKEGKIVVLTIHGVPDGAHPWVNTPPELFVEYLEYLKKNHYKVIAMRDMKQYIDMDKAVRLHQNFKN